MDDDDDVVVVVVAEAAAAAAATVVLSRVSRSFCLAFLRMYIPRPNVAATKRSDIGS